MKKDDIKVANILDLTKTDYAFIFKGVEYVYEALPLIKAKFDDMVRALDHMEYNRIKDGVFVHKSVTVLKSVFLGRNIIIGKDAEIRNSALLRENIVIGDGCLVGNSCELKNTLMFNESKAAHFNYCGDTILGYKAHLGAGVITSNLKLDKTLIKLNLEDGVLDTNLKKFGAILGDNVEVGCNTVLNPGTVIGRNTNIYPLSNIRGVIDSNSIYKGINNTVKKETRV